MGETSGAHALRPLETQNEEHQEHEEEQHGSAEREVRAEAVRRLRAEDDKNARKGVNDWFMRPCLFRRNDSRREERSSTMSTKGEVKHQGDDKRQRAAQRSSMEERRGGAASRGSTQRNDAGEQHRGGTERGANE